MISAAVQSNMITRLPTKRVDFGVHCVVSSISQQGSVPLIASYMDWEGTLMVHPGPAILCMPLFPEILPQSYKSFMLFPQAGTLMQRNKEGS